MTEDKLKMWAEHFHEVLNCEPPVEELIDIAIAQITRFEVKAALKKVKDNKAAEIDKLPGKLLKVNPERTIKELFILFN